MKRKYIYIAISSFVLYSEELEPYFVPLSTPPLPPVYSQQLTARGLQHSPPGEERAAITTHPAAPRNNYPNDVKAPGLEHVSLAGVCGYWSYGPAWMSFQVLPGSLACFSQSFWPIAVPAAAYVYIYIYIYIYSATELESLSRRLALLPLMLACLLDGASFIPVVSKLHPRFLGSKHARGKK